MDAGDEPTPVTWVTRPSADTVIRISCGAGTCAAFPSRTRDRAATVSVNVVTPAAMSSTRIVVVATRCDFSDVEACPAAMRTVASATSVYTRTSPERKRGDRSKFGAAHAETMSPSRSEAIAARRTRSVYVCWVASPGMAIDPALSALARAAGESGIFCDFDGCLAPIVSDPDDARPVDGAEAVLDQLASRFRIVAIVSGRSVADLAGRISARGVRLVGLHGMEQLRDGEVHVHAKAEAARAAIERAGASMEPILRDVPGAQLERKGLALAVHFRRAADPDAAEAIAGPLVRDAAAAEGLDVVPGRRILEVRPKAGGDKGDAVLRMIEEESLRGALVAGDDVGDLPAFDAIAGLEIAVRVAVSSPESPEELSTRADVVVGSPEAFLTLLERLARDAATA